MKNQLDKNFKPKIIFFDIDDTLSRAGIMTENSKEMLKLAAKSDAKLIIATGRPLPMLPADVVELVEQNILDAVVCMNGQYSYTKEKIISEYALEKNQAHEIVSICRNAEMIYKFESTDIMAWSENALTHPKLKDFIEKNDNFVIDPDFYQKKTVYQCSVFFTDDYRMHDVDFDKHNLKFVPWPSLGADILPKEASKARGIRDMCEHFDIDVKETMAFGDGLNDFEMFDLVGYAIAMGDGADSLKERADFVTGTIEDDSIRNVLIEMSII